MRGLTALFDANVLYPAGLRNFLMHLALTGLFRAKWSADIHEEWISSLLKKRPDLTRSQLDRTRDLMDKHAIGALVTGYKSLIPALRLPDPNDRHVLAAAIRGHASVIVTINLRDFPRSTTRKYGITVQHPDAFVLDLLTRAPELVAAAANDHRRSLKRPPRTVPQYLASLRQQGLPQTALVLGSLLA